MTTRDLIKTRNLPQGAKTHIEVDGKEIVVSFHKMDGHYGHRFDDKGEMYIFNAYFHKKGGFYEITNKEGTNPTGKTTT